MVTNSRREARALTVRREESQAGRLLYTLLGRTGAVRCEDVAHKTEVGRWGAGHEDVVEWLSGGCNSGVKPEFTWARRKLTRTWMAVGTV